MTFEEYQIEELEKQLSKQEGYEVTVSVLSLIALCVSFLALGFAVGVKVGEMK